MQPPRLTALSTLPLGIRDSACFTCFSQQTVYFSPGIIGLDDGASMTPNGGAHRGSYRVCSHHPQHGNNGRTTTFAMPPDERGTSGPTQSWSETIRQVLDDVGWSDASHHSQNERQNVTNTVLYEAQCALESTVGD